MATVRKNSAVLTVPIARRGSDHGGGDGGAPTPAADRVEEAADDAQRRHDPRRAYLLRLHVMGRAPEDVEAHQGQVADDEGLDDVAFEAGEQIGPGGPADHAGEGQGDEQPPLDVPVEHVAAGGSGGGEDLRAVDAGRGRRGRHSERQKDRAGEDAVGHAQGPVDRLRQETHEHEQEKGVHPASPG